MTNRDLIEWVRANPELAGEAGVMLADRLQMAVDEIDDLVLASAHGSPYGAMRN